MTGYTVIGHLYESPRFVLKNRGHSLHAVSHFDFIAQPGGSVVGQSV